MLCTFSKLEIKIIIILNYLAGNIEIIVIHISIF